MATTQSNSIAPEPPQNIRTLLENLDRYAVRLGEGRQAVAYRFKPVVEGLDDYVIRIPKSRDLQKDLLASTSLTPAARIVSKINIGNRLMELDAPLGAKEDSLESHSNSISILLYQHGKNLEDIEKTNMQGYVQDCTLRGEPPAFGYVQAMVDTVSIIRNVVEKNGFNPYVRMFKKVYALGYAGLEADVYLRNILFSQEHMTLRMCDQENRFLKMPITTEKQAQEALYKVGYNHFKEFDWDREIKESHHELPPQLKRQYEESKAYIKGLLTEAYEKTLIQGSERDAPDSSGLPTIPKRIEFAAVENTQAVSLTDPPKVLVEQLRHIVKTADITR